MDYARQILFAYPFATSSSLVTYAALFLLLFQKPRAFLESRLTLGSSKGSTHLAGFDAFRGFAAAFVAMAHCWYFTYPIFASTQLVVAPLQYGAKAVPIFAALSGFLIYISARNIQSFDGLREYIRRRFFRIYPVYIFTILLIILIGKFESVGGDVSLWSLFLSQLFMLRSLGYVVIANPVAWSLYVEVIFYLVIPIYVVLIPEKRRFAITLATFIVLTACASQLTDRVFDLWPFFFSGILAVEVSTVLSAQFLKLYAVPAYLAGLLLLLLDMNAPKYDLFFRFGLVPFDTTGSSVQLALAMFLLLAGLRHAPKIGNFFDWLPLRILGSISYSLFLIHPIYIALNFPDLRFSQIGQQYEFWKTLPQFPSWYLPLVFFPGILFWASLTFVAVEKPFMRWRRSGAVKTDAAAAAEQRAW